ncbi:SRPBCC domain-containing protein [Phytohabitans houttuyneae]|uniref:Activator of Hsp90 ATPase homologue 1/2-like C-terminal domain-containing protein n=1 Tax=Phytohabitans houttuyneae TaxID=1076126 RepID=A0A6V8KGJ9_9ACTN|nr:SRPBCC domain-containing protein [Phytohabitans houttuyneae]GFJ81528.1 hypothetical protein Phou_057080 [Phytohabitans houttuyneae]
MSGDYVALPSDWVRVSCTVPLPPREVWSALTEPDRVAQWLGSLNARMTPGHNVVLDFGDGDFFDVVVHDVRAEDRIAFEWRFLGVGPASEVRWSLSTEDGHSTVTVDDSCPGRPPSETAQLRAGWLDFLNRLATHLTTGESARYRWREVIDGGADLPAGTWRPLRDGSITDWLPVAAESGKPRWFFVVDSDGPRRFAIRDWKLIPDKSLTFAVAVPQATAVTRCEVLATETEQGSRLAISHTGWSELGLGDLQARGLRHRFAAAWTAALALAEDHAHRTARSGPR